MPKYIGTEIFRSNGQTETVTETKLTTLDKCKLIKASVLCP
jgi:hypothetical protein